MKKILFGIIFASVLVHNSVGNAYADAPQILFDLDCTSTNKDLKIGFESDPATPGNGAEIIAFRFVFDLNPGGTTTVNDLLQAQVNLNPTYTNAFEANKETSSSGSTVSITIEGGFTQEMGYRSIEDLMILSGIQEKAYTIVVREGDLIPKGSVNDVYVDTPPQQFQADPGSCQTGSGTTTTGSAPTMGIILVADKPSATAGENVAVTATISGRVNESINWSQTSGSAIQPQIANQVLANGDTESVLTFSMPTGSTDILLKLTVGEISENISIQSVVAEETHEAATETDTTGQTLEERLAERQAEQAAAAAAAASQTTTTGSVATQTGTLSESGPAENSLLILIAVIVLWIGKHAGKKLKTMKA
ncbi:MAG: hypothetical protein Q8O95_03940 [bacterium]|nr:hypothetical protein [bacterium]